MTIASSNVAKTLFKAGAFLLVLNEIRGVIVAAPVFYGIYQAGGTLAAVWLAICSLAGIALSVIVPAILVKKFASIPPRQRHAG